MWGFALQDRALRSIKHMIANDKKGMVAATPSATCPHESVLPIRLRPDFLVVFEGYAVTARLLPPAGRRADSLRHVHSDVANDVFYARRGYAGRNSGGRAAPILG